MVRIYENEVICFQWVILNNSNQMITGFWNCSRYFFAIHKVTFLLKKIQIILIFPYFHHQQSKAFFIDYCFYYSFSSRIPAWVRGLQQPSTITARKKEQRTDRKNGSSTCFCRICINELKPFVYFLEPLWDTIFFNCTILIPFVISIFSLKFKFSLQENLNMSARVKGLIMSSTLNKLWP